MGKEAPQPEPDLPRPGESKSTPIVARVLCTAIDQELSASFQYATGPDRSRDEALLRLHGRSVEILSQAGYDEEVTALLSANWTYYTRLTLRDAATRVLNASSPSHVAGLPRVVIAQILQDERSLSLLPPTLSDYTTKMPEPERGLAARVLELDNVFQQARYRSAIETVLDFL